MSNLTDFFGIYRHNPPPLSGVSFDARGHRYLSMPPNGDKPSCTSLGKMASDPLGVVAPSGRALSAGRIEASAYPNALHLANANHAMLLALESFLTA